MNADLSLYEEDDKFGKKTDSFESIQKIAISTMSMRWKIFDHEFYTMDHAAKWRSDAMVSLKLLGVRGKFTRAIWKCSAIKWNVLFISQRAISTTHRNVAQFWNFE